LKIINNDNKKVVTSTTWNVCLKEEETAFPMNFKGYLSQKLKATCTFTESKTNGKVSYTHDFSYILTPPPAETPKINGPKVIGAGTGHPFLFRIVATGINPIVFSAENLPAGLSLDVNSGIITGSVKQAGEYRIRLMAKIRKERWSVV
jgi:alpha-galactosidase